MCIGKGSLACTSPFWGYGNIWLFDFSSAIDQQFWLMSLVWASWWVVIIFMDNLAGEMSPPCSGRCVSIVLSRFFVDQDSVWHYNLVRMECTFDPRDSRDLWAPWQTQLCASSASKSSRIWLREHTHKQDGIHSQGPMPPMAFSVPKRNTQMLEVWRRIRKCQSEDPHYCKGCVGKK